MSLCRTDNFQSNQPASATDKLAHAEDHFVYDELLNSTRELSLTDLSYASSSRVGTGMTTTGRALPTVEVQLNSPFAMYPLLYQAPLPTGVPYIMDPTGGPMTTTPGIFPLLGSVYPQPQSVLRMTSDSVQGRHGYMRPDNRRQHAARISRSSYYNLANHHNQVDVNRIREGIDVRTTVGGDCHSLRHC